MDFQTRVNDVSRQRFQVRAESFVSFVSFVVQICPFHLDTKPLE